VTVPVPDSEFDLLVDDAAEFGVQFGAAPGVERREVAGSLSALVWNKGTP
jgi:hypothetical protein